MVSDSFWQILPFLKPRLRFRHFIGPNLHLTNNDQFRCVLFIFCFFVLRNKVTTSKFLINSLLFVFMSWFLWALQLYSIFISFLLLFPLQAVPAFFILYPYTYRHTIAKLQLKSIQKVSNHLFQLDLFLSVHRIAK